MTDLLIDAGNTRIKWGLTRGNGAMVERGAVPTADPVALADLLRDRRVIADRALYVSVAGDKVNRVIEQTLTTLCSERWARFLSVAQIGVLRNDYARPEQLGADRLAAALGAWQRVRGDCLVVSCGTATTIDRVEAWGLAGRETSSLIRSDERIPPAQKKSANATFSGQGRFAGGVILPGIDLMKSALYRNTAQLPDAAGRLVVTPDNTDDAIETGCLLAQLGAVEAMWRHFAHPVPVVLAGGASGSLRAPLIARGLPVIEAPELVLEGLAVAILHRFS